MLWLNLNLPQVKVMMTLSNPFLSRNLPTPLKSSARRTWTKGSWKCSRKLPAESLMSDTMSTKWAHLTNSLPRTTKRSFRPTTIWTHHSTNSPNRWPVPNSAKFLRLSDQFNLKTKINGSRTKLNTTLRFWRTSWRRFLFERAPSQRMTECSTNSRWSTSASKIRLT